MTQPRTVYDYCRTQPAVLAGMMARRAELVGVFRALYRSTAPDRIYLFGTGTSFNAAATAAPFVQDVLQTEVTVATPTRVPRIDGANPLLVFVSQEGTSTNTLDIMARLSDHAHIAITGVEGSELERHARHHMLIGCGEETAGPKTLGYTASVMCLYLAALETARALGTAGAAEYGDCVAALSRAAESMADNLTRAEAWFARNVDDLAAVEKFALVGDADADAIAAEGALKILETVRIPVVHYEFEEYLHGPVVATDARLGGLFFVPHAGAQRSRMTELARFHRQRSRYAYRVTSEDDPSDPRTLTVIPGGRAFTDVFDYIVAPQLLAALLPGVRNVTGGDEIFGEISERLATKVRRNGRP